MYERSEWADEATASLSTPATEPQGYVEGLEAAMAAIKKVPYDFHQSAYAAALHAVAALILAARPAPQPAADTPALNDELATMISDLSHTGELSMLYRMEIADRITALRAIIGTATPAIKSRRG